MEEQDQTPSRLIEELAELRRRMAQLETTIAQQKKSQEALRESEGRFRALFETLTLGVVYQNRNGEIIRANPAADRILGLTLDQLQRRTSLDPGWRAIHEDGSDFPEETHPAMQALEKGREVNDEVMGGYHPSRGDYVWINIQAVPQFRPGEDRPFQVYTTFEEIAEKKQALDEIKLLARFPSENPNPVKEKEERIRFITDNMVDLLSQVDASPLGVSLMGPDGRTKYLNPKFAAIFGYTQEDVPAGRDWFRKAYPDEAYRREVIAQWLKDLQAFPRGESRPSPFLPPRSEDGGPAWDWRPFTGSSRGTRDLLPSVTASTAWPKRSWTRAALDLSRSPLI